MTGPSADPAAAATPRAGDYLAAATEIAEQLRERAVWHAGRCTWLGYDVDPVGDRWTTVYRTIDESLYGGLPGVALFLAELFALTGEPGDADAASGAIRQALWLLHHQRRVARHGFYSGEAGILWAIREVEERLDAVLDDGWCGDAERRLLGPADLDGPAELDLVDGISGTIAGLLARRGAKDRPEVVESCRRWAERLIGASRAGPGVGRSWSGAASEPLARQPLCGLAHGASSAALALLELWSAAGDDRYREAAFEGFRYERQWFSRRHGNWPDLRDAAGPEPSRPEHRAHPTYWCYGAGGIGLARLRAFQLTGDRSALAEANAALFACKRQAELVLGAAERARDFDLNASVCHGVGSLIDLLLTSHRLGHDREALPLARRLGDAAIARARQHREWLCGVVDGGETPGLMLGLAGIGLLFLGLHAPQRFRPVGLPCAPLQPGSPV
jgi:lantibiotic modifying enzyme